MSENVSLLPTGKHLDTLLDLQWGAEVESLLDRSLLNPLREFLDRPGKKIRGKMVELGFSLARSQFAMQEGSAVVSERTNLLQEATELLEMIHAASLVIDDIQDNSQERRGEPTLHRTLGLPLALNAGNWLYFWPLQRVEAWELDPSTKNAVYAHIHRGLLRAHFGQAVDIGINILSVPQGKIPAVCLASLELKSGALMAMAFSLGALLGGADPKLLAVCDRFGHAFGIALQMFDDAGNVGRTGPKQFEDLSLKRPSWVVSVAAENCTPAEFQEFSALVESLPEAKTLNAWIEANGLLGKVRARAQVYLEEAISYLETETLDPTRVGGNNTVAVKVIEGVRALATQLVRAYV